MNIFNQENRSFQPVTVPPTFDLSNFFTVTIIGKLLIIGAQSV